MSLVVIKILLTIATPAVSALFLVPVFLAPLPVWLCIAVAVLYPAAMWAFYRLIRRAVRDATYADAESELQTIKRRHSERRAVFAGDDD